MPSDANVYDILLDVFRQFFRVVSITDLNNPTPYEKLENDLEFQNALKRLAAFFP